MPRTTSWLRHLPTARPRLLVSLIGGGVAWLLLPASMHEAGRLVLAWDIVVMTFLVLVLRMMRGSTPDGLRFRARLEDEGRWVILALVTAAALSSLLAIGAVLHDAKQLPGLLAVVSVAFVGCTILLSWGFVHTMFALHYAHAFYGDRPALAGPPRPGEVERAGGLGFPGEEHPDYWDFLYFSFVVGMTCQVSDVQVLSRSMRRLALGHGILAFLFNTVILALSINLVAGLL